MERINLEKNIKEKSEFDKMFEKSISITSEILEGVKLSNIEKMRLKQILLKHVHHSKNDEEKVDDIFFSGNNPYLGAVVEFLRDYYELDLTDDNQRDILRYLRGDLNGPDKRTSIRDYFKDKQRDAHLP